MYRRKSLLICLAAIFVVALFLVSSVFVASTYGASSSSLLSRNNATAGFPKVVPAVIIVSSNQPTVTCSPSGLCPAMMDKAYGFDTLQKQGVNGTGQTILIDDACGDPSIATDLKTFDSQFGLPNPKLNILYPEGQKNLCANGGWSVETSLDVEWSHAVAPSATIDLLVANQPSAPDMYKAWTYALNNHLGNQISNSYAGAGCFVNCNNTIGQGIGPCTLTNGTQGFNVQKVLNQARSDYVTIMGSAGDSGAWGLGTSAEEPIPADCKGVLTVGGTTLQVDSNGNYLGESAWGGTGGGYVTTPVEPKYQKAAGITDSFGTLAKPDVAADADPSSGVWFYNGGWGIVGGTSLSSPLWVGFMALVNQIRAKNGLHPAGFINPFLYTKIYGPNGSHSLYSKDFHDVTSGNNGWPAGKGWDADTGLGSFIAPSLAKTMGTSPGA